TSLSGSEAALLLDSQCGSRLFRQGQEIITEGRTCRTLFVVMDGVAIRYRILRDGRRHVLNLLLPGDIAGVPGCFFETALYSVRALTDLSAAPVPFARITSLFRTDPQLVARIFWSFSCQAA